MHKFKTQLLCAPLQMDNFCLQYCKYKLLHVILQYHNFQHLDELSINVVDFETIEKGYGIFKCPSELHDVKYQSIIKSMIIKCLLEEQPETEARNDLLNIIDMKINEEYALASLRQTPGKDRFEDTERLLLSNIAILDQSLPLVEDLVTMAKVVNHKALHEFILLNVRNKPCHLQKSLN